MGSHLTHNSQHAAEDTHGGPTTNSRDSTRAKGGPLSQFPNGETSLGFDAFIDLIRESCTDGEAAENYLVYAFAMFDRNK